MSKRVRSLESYPKGVLVEFIRRTTPVGPAELSKLEGLAREAAIDRALRRSEELLARMNRINSGPAGLAETKLFMELSDEYERLNLRIARLRKLA